MIDTLRSKGHMIFINETSRGTVYRMRKPTKAILAVYVSEVLLSDNADKTIKKRYQSTLWYTFRL